MTITLVGQLHEKVRVVVRDVAVRLHVVQLETHRQIVLGEGNDILAVCPGSGRIRSSKTAVADDAVEDALLRDQEPLILCHERPRLPQLDAIANLGVALVLHRQGVDRLLERLDHRLGRRQFR